MHAEFPRTVVHLEDQAGEIAALVASSMHDCNIAAPRELSDEDQTLVDLRYESLLAQVELDRLMDDVAG